MMDDLIARLRAKDPTMSRLNEAAELIPGWSPPDQLLALHTAALSGRSSARDGDIVEVGAWCGRSTVALALAARQTGRKLHTVDVFPERDDWVRNPDGTWSIRTLIGSMLIDACRTHTVWDEAFQASILPVYHGGASPRLRLEQALDRFAVRDVVTVHRGTGAMFRAAHPDLRIGLLFLDADHSEEAVRADIEGFLPMMLPGAIMCFDDAFTTYDGVDRALTETLLRRSPPVLEYGVRITRKMFLARLRG